MWPVGFALEDFNFLGLVFHGNKRLSSASGSTK